MRIVVIGNSGSGKSSFARRIAEANGLARLELDMVVWEPHQVAVARRAGDVRADVERFLAEHDRWVIEGCDADLAEIALPRATELVWLNPSIETCVANNRRRPWEPHKFESAEAQEANQANLLAWVATYPTRTGGRSQPYHRAVFDRHAGPKLELGDAASRVASVAPHLRHAQVEPMLGGWTSDTFDAGGRVVQIARSAYAERTLRTQARVLPLLAPRLPVRVPAPVLIAEQPVAIEYGKLDGVPCDEAPDTSWPEELGRALRALHAIAPAELGLEEVTAAELRERARVRCSELRASVMPRLSPDERLRADVLLAAYLDDDRAWRFEPTVTHNDLAPEHVLAGESLAIIDWEEVRAGDPIGDLAWWVHAMPAAGARIVAAYGAVDERFPSHTRCTHALAPWHEVDHGLRVHDDGIIAAGLADVRARLPR